MILKIDFYARFVLHTKGAKRQVDMKPPDQLELRDNLNDCFIIDHDLKAQKRTVVLFKVL